MDSDLNEVQEQGEGTALRAALQEGRHDRALAMAERGMEDPKTPDWLVTSEGLRVALAADDPEQVVDQMSDARRLSLRRLGREPDALEHEVEAFRAKNAVGEAMRVAAGRALDRRLGIPVRNESMQVVWFREEDDLEARRRWPMWAAGLAVDEPFAARAARMERSLRSRRADGDGPIVVCGSPSSSPEFEGTA